MLGIIMGEPGLAILRHHLVNQVMRPDAHVQPEIERALATFIGGNKDVGFIGPVSHKDETKTNVMGSEDAFANQATLLLFHSLTYYLR